MMEIFASSALMELPKSTPCIQNHSEFISLLNLIFMISAVNGPLFIAHVLIE